MPVSKLVTTNQNNQLQVWSDEELESLVDWLREPFFFLRESTCDEDFGDLADEDESAR